MGELEPQSRLIFDDGLAAFEAPQPGVNILHNHGKLFPDGVFS